jgi:hypothetical protein
VTFPDRLARRHSLLRVCRRLVEEGLCPASCCVVSTMAHIEMRDVVVGEVLSGWSDDVG